MIKDTLILLFRSEENREIFLGRKKVGFGEGKFVGVGGGIEKGENKEQTAVRELYEETGIRIEESALNYCAELTFIFPVRPKWNRVLYVFVVDQFEGEPQESDEIEPHWFPIDELPLKNMWADDAYWMKRVIAGEKLKGKFTFAYDNETVAGHKLKKMK